MDKLQNFIDKANEAHNFKYGYSKVNYINNNTKVCIICPIHGEFWQTPHSHLDSRKPQGCPICGGKKKHTLESFVEKAKQTHGDKYGYSKVEYVNNKTKVCITCKKHGDFWQKPKEHLKGNGCQNCAIEENALKRRMPLEEFIKKARTIHGNKYDYSKVNYINSLTNICIICHEKDEEGKEHGEFWQTPSNHLLGKGCSKCSKHYTLTKAEFIEKAVKIHGNKYDYSKVEYVDNKTPITIICPKHGEFTQQPFVHLRGNGCNLCGNEEIGNKLRLGRDKFIEKARKIHGVKYDYSKVQYINNSTKVEISCPKHGLFYMTPQSHLKGKGCPLCNQSHLENNVMQILNDLSIEFETQKTFDWLKYEHKQRLDFFLPKYNIAIECQGEQHFEEVEY